MKESDGKIEKESYKESCLIQGFRGFAEALYPMRPLPDFSFKAQNQQIREHFREVGKYMRMGMDGYKEGNLTGDEE